MVCLLMTPVVTAACVRSFLLIRRVSDKHKLQISPAEEGECGFTNNNESLGEDLRFSDGVCFSHGLALVCCLVSSALK